MFLTKSQSFQTLNIKQKNRTPGFRLLWIIEIMIISRIKISTKGKQICKAGLKTNQPARDLGDASSPSAAMSALKSKGF